MSTPLGSQPQEALLPDGDVLLPDREARGFAFALSWPGASVGGATDPASLRRRAFLRLLLIKRRQAVQEGKAPKLGAMERSKLRRLARKLRRAKRKELKGWGVSLSDPGPARPPFQPRYAPTRTTDEHTSAG